MELGIATPSDSEPIQTVNYGDVSMAPNGLSILTRQIIYHQAKTGLPNIASVAMAMHMSIRTLQRKLKQAGFRFSDLLLEAKKELAISYLEQSYSLAQISDLLGYTEVSSFIRAFKNWFGCSPAVYKRQRLS